MATKQETRIVRDIMMKLVKNHNFDGYHVHGSPMQRPGEPDIDGSVYHNHQWLHLKIEVKTPTGKPSALQIARLRSYFGRNYVAGVVTNYDETARLLNAFSAWFNNSYDHPFFYYLSEVELTDPYGIYRGRP